jgi:hypothetical protein
MFQEQLAFLRTVLLSGMKDCLLKSILYDVSLELNSSWFQRLKMLQEKCNLSILYSIATSKDGRKLRSIRDWSQSDSTALEKEGLVERFGGENTVRITPEGENFISNLVHLLEYESRLLAAICDSINMVA